SRTTMSAFAMCGACRAEYDDPRDRRFHSETNACPECGPRLSASIDDAISRLRDGEIIAVKGIGGFQLAVDATNERAVARLREKKTRPHKPFAVMARDLDVAARFVAIDNVARAALLDASRPIVCLPKREHLAPSVAPGLNEVGVMLPCAPLHHLLLAGGPGVLVMTSGNGAGEPIAIDNDEAIRRLSGIADAFVFHDREIHARADDSVVRIVGSAPQPVRRSRGVVPDAIPLPFATLPILAVGAEMKNTICVTRGRAAYMSQHIGDLSHPLSLAFFEEVIRRHDVLAVAHDLHPDYRSTRWAMQSSLTRIAVQHHHAHIASCMADNGRTGRVIGVAFDGTGCGPAGELWGGEFLICDLERFRRVGHVRAIALPGGEAAIREPWRLAVAARVDAGLEGLSPRVEQMLKKKLNCPDATSVGRWFDAVAALCGLRETITFEGQAAMELETIADREGEPYPFEITGEGEIDLRPMIRAIVAGGETAGLIAARFHETLAQAVAQMCERVRKTDNIDTVALSGGCFQNKLLTERSTELLQKRGFEVLLHRRVPPNDGGIALGQAAVAAFRLRGELN
ncbi:MAG: carbamoyltransferase HypF, partial [Acidobacteriota bacterium]|nr:carbamoyltransferase HypF [Acidobacteriota bacterium]